MSATDRTLIYAIPLTEAGHIIDCIASSTVQLPARRKAELAYLVCHRTELRGGDDRRFLNAVMLAKFPDEPELNYPLRSVER